MYRDSTAAIQRMEELVELMALHRIKTPLRDELDKMCAIVDKYSDSNIVLDAANDLILDAESVVFRSRLSQEISSRQLSVQ